MIDIDSLIRHRGDEVRDREGRKVGRLEEVYVDDDTGAPRWVLVHTGAFASRRAFVPVEGAESTGTGLRLAFTRDQVADAPRVRGEDHLSLEEEAALHRHYGVTPAAPAEPARTGGEVETSTDGAMTRSEEELHVERTRRASGRARLRKHVVTEHVTITVPVQREEVRLEREPAGEAEAGTAAEGGLAGAGLRGAGDEATGSLDADATEPQTEMVLHEEQLVIDKRVVPKERVRLVKDAVTEDEPVEDVVRKERVEVERDNPQSGSGREGAS